MRASGRVLQRELGGGHCDGRPPGQELELALLMLDERRAALDPVSVVAIQQAVALEHGRLCGCGHKSPRRRPPRAPRAARRSETSGCSAARCRCGPSRAARATSTGGRGSRASRAPNDSSRAASCMRPRRQSSDMVPHFNRVSNSSPCKTSIRRPSRVVCTQRRWTSMLPNCTPTRARRSWSWLPGT